MPNQTRIFIVSNSQTENQTNCYDLIIIGGGINGAGLAADAASRGLSVLLCEKDDLANATSSASSKLIHGGLRYLEYYEFRLVREALAEREVMLKKAPHIVWPLRFILPHRPHLRPVWMIRAGLFLYDHLGKRKTLKGSNSVKFDATSPLKPEITRGFEYSDCWVDDARLVILNALDAQNHGAKIATRTYCTQAERKTDHWLVTLKNTLTNEITTAKANALVNATGPWVASFIKDNMRLKSPYGIRLIKGSHIVIPKLYDGEHAYILQNADKRIVFVIPYLNKFTLVGTTDVEYQGDPNSVKISEEEIAYLIDVTNHHFKQQIKADDVISSYSGVRPLCDDESADPAAITRDYTITKEDQDGKLPLVSIFGGKITTYRKLANAAMAKLTEFFPNLGASVTETSVLPGGDIGNFEDFLASIKTNYSWLDDDTQYRYARSYGSLCKNFLKNKTQLSDLGAHFGHGLFQAEVDYLTEHEWALTTDDILWRRTKLGISFSAEDVKKLAGYLHKKTRHQSQ